jgi:hypothetical protein
MQPGKSYLSIGFFTCKAKDQLSEIINHYDLLGLHVGAAVAARQPYDVKRIIETSKKSHEASTESSCRWNATA